jgi:hypothetical protein
MKHLKRFNEGKKSKEVKSKERIELNDFLETVYKYCPDFKDDVEETDDSLEFEVCYTLVEGYCKFKKGFPYKFIENINNDEGDNDTTRSAIFQRKSDGKYFILWVGCDSTDEWRICKYLEEVTKTKVKNHKWI